MAEITLASASQKQIWVNTFIREYVRESSYMPYMGSGTGSIFRVRNELMSSAGNTINFPLIGRFKGRGVIGSEVLEGNEEDLGNYNDAVVINWLRNGFVVPKSTSYLTDLDIMSAGKDQLRTWDAENLRDSITNALGSVIVPGATDANGFPGTDTAVAYAAATAAQRNTYLVNNSDRVLFGNSKSNASSGVWATALGTVSTATGKATAGTIGLLKRIAKTADPHIRPFKSDMTKGREYFVWFVNSLVFRDLSADTTIIQANTQARAREGNGMDDNPLFQDGDLMYQGVIIREVPELPVLTGVGAAGIDVAQGFFCGQSAVAIAYGQDPVIRVDTKRDYEFRPGVAIEELRGQKKVSFAGKMFGTVVSVNAAVADA